MDEINEWIRPKSVHWRVMNDKMDLSQRDDVVRQNEIWLPAIPMTPGKFTDSGYRFRENLLDKKDSWVPFLNSIISNHEYFHEVLLFSSDTLTVGEDHPTIAEMYFRMSVDRIVH